MQLNDSGPSPRRAAALLTAVALGGLIALSSVATGGVADHVRDALVVAIEAVGVLAVLARAAREHDLRAAWALIGCSLLLWTAGDIVWALSDGGGYPYAADVLYVALYPVALAGMALLLSDGRDRVAARLWVDGVIAGLTTGALAIAFAFDPIAKTSELSSAATVVALVYPLADLVLIAVVLTAFATQAWRPGAAWLLLGAGVAILAVADTLYAYQGPAGTYDKHGVVAALFTTAVATWGWAAWQPRRPRRRSYGFGSQTFALPAGFAALAVALLLHGQFARIPASAALLATGALLVATARAGATFRQNTRLLRASREEALTDGLTGLPNRRRLLQDLERAVAECGPGRQRTLAFFDLDGFKRYNDSFGHAAGDVLLGRLARRLAAAVAGHGRAYRLGGDEFCVLFDAARAREDRLMCAAAAALSARGEGFGVSASCGLVTIPREAESATHALQLADERMYAAKDASRQSRGHETSEALLQVLREREPDLHEHLNGVATLAAEVARRLGLAADAVDEVVRAAELHDIGKVAVPDAILRKPGPLDDDEWRLMREHTIVGDRILRAAPALRPVARIVRASHERWDGGGYPDGLAGEAIPLGARIVAVCDAYDAMTSDRPYQRPLPHATALAELRRCAGTQFDPAVVEAFCAVVERHGARTPPEPTGALGGASGA